MHVTGLSGITPKKRPKGKIPASPLGLDLKHGETTMSKIVSSHNRFQKSAASTDPSILGAHARLLERIAVDRPYEIHFVADPDDIEERGQQMDRLFKAFITYVDAFVEDTARSTWALHADRRYDMERMDSIRDDIVATFERTAESLRDVAA